MRSFKVNINDVDSGLFAVDEYFSVAASDIVDAAIKANDIAVAIVEALARFNNLDLNLKTIRVNSISDEGELLGYESGLPSTWINEYVVKVVDKFRNINDN